MLFLLVLADTKCTRCCSSLHSGEGSHPPLRLERPVAVWELRSLEIADFHSPQYYHLTGNSHRKVQNVLTDSAATCLELINRHGEIAVRDVSGYSSIGTIGVSQPARSCGLSPARRRPRPVRHVPW